jgi:aspartyl-tRNA(Asn)/glutamyl-tRNA(Gln) amidotransferase subunit A
MSDALCFLSIAELSARYADGTCSPVDIVRAHLTRAARLEPKLQAFQLIDEDGALRAAAASAARWRAGRPVGALDGVPLTIKDNVDVAGFPTRHGSRTSDDAPAETDAPVVARLREAGAVILGKTRLPEFGWKGLTDGPLHDQPTRNPSNLAHTPGGSSGGAAACVAAGIGTVAFGNDGGGSIRGPASFCGLFGLKPTFGRVPHDKHEGPFGTLVAGGPITRSVADAIITLDVMARPDDRDWFALPPPPAGWLAALRPRLRDLRFAYAPELGGVAPDAEVRRVVEAAVATLAAQGARITTLGPIIDPLRPSFEAYWLAGFAKRLRAIPPARHDEMDPQLRRLAEQGLAVGIEALLAGEAARAALGRRLGAVHREYDLLLTPSMPHAAPTVGTIYHTDAYDRWRDGVPYSLPFNLTGQPAATLPCGVTHTGLPVGLQVVGPRFAERAILEACLGIEQALGVVPPAARLRGLASEPRSGCGPRANLTG